MKIYGVMVMTESLDFTDIELFLTPRKALEFVASKIIPSDLSNKGLLLQADAYLSKIASFDDWHVDEGDYDVHDESGDVRIQFFVKEAEE